MESVDDSVQIFDDTPTKEAAVKINPINKDTVHRICSGQVVLNLAIAVKELVENSLDAGATVIEIRLKEYGEELVEVLDNGSGVTEENFSGLALKYHTSKLREFSDLLGVSTFGFRGEALSSLCALSTLTITTCHSSAETGTKITYDHKGEITSASPCARQVGTTVSLSGIFSTLPVRQKEFHRNIKREFNKMTQLLYAYCLVSEEVKIICTNQTSKGKSVVVATQGGSIRDNIACVFGVKQLQSLLELRPFYPENFTTNIKENFFNNLENIKIEPVAISPEERIDVSDIKSEDELELSEDSSNDAGEVKSTPSSAEFSSSQLTQCSTVSENSQKRSQIKQPFDFKGYISSCAHGSGRSTTERQFFYVNSRPCEPNKVMKLVNEVYRSYNPHQSPFVYLNLKIKRSAVDVNVTPDKRKLFLDREKYLIDVIKTSLTKIFENIPSTFKMENTKNAPLSASKYDNDNISNSESAPRIFSSFLSQFASKFPQNESISCKKKSNTSMESKRKANSSLDDYITNCKVTRTVSPDVLMNEIDETFNIETSEKELLDNEQQSLSNTADTDTTVDCQDNLIVTEVNDISIENTDVKETVYLGFSDYIPLSQVVDIKEVICDQPSSKSDTIRKNIEKKKTVTDTHFEKLPLTRKTVKVHTTLELIRSLMNETTTIKEANRRNTERVKFRTEINPVYNKKCEEELKKEISKHMFSEMKIIGQFNLGFIITHLEDDLFIIDQHATDEKYNFETLQQTTVLSNQKLVVPQPMELTGVNERILIDNLEICHKNGFTFEINEDALPTKRVKLVTLPISKNYVFGKEDVEELLFMLKDSPNAVCRPSRVRTMFASRACRKSVMIGTALSKSDMRRLVDHMGAIDQPWNCPHGRPTIRHLINMALIHS